MLQAMQRGCSSEGYLIVAAANLPFVPVQLSLGMAEPSNHGRPIRERILVYRSVELGRSTRPTPTASSRRQNLSRVTKSFSGRLVLCFKSDVEVGDVLTDVNAFLDRHDPVVMRLAVGPSPAARVRVKVDL